MLSALKMDQVTFLEKLKRIERYSTRVLGIVEHFLAVENNFHSQPQTEANAWRHAVRLCTLADFCTKVVNDEVKLIQDMHNSLVASVKDARVDVINPSDEQIYLAEVSNNCFDVCVLRKNIGSNGDASGEAGNVDVNMN